MKIMFDKWHESARCWHVLLWFSQKICHLITMNVETRITCFNHLFFVEQSHGLSFTFELQSINKLISQDCMRAKLNNHRMTLWRKLHERKERIDWCLHYRDTLDDPPLYQSSKVMLISFQLWQTFFAQFSNFVLWDLIPLCVVGRVGIVLIYVSTLPHSCVTLIL